MLKNIIMDMGNVLLTFEPEYALSRYCPNDECRDIIRRELFEGPAWDAGDMGDITNSERYDCVAPHVPEKYHKALKDVVERWDECMEPLPGAPEFIDTVRAWGLNVYVLSNACTCFREYFPHKFPYSLFSGIVVSSEEHMMKPDVRIYQLLLSRYGLDPAECVFIDDRQTNLDGAARAGIPGIRFEGDYARLTAQVDALRKGE